MMRFVLLGSVIGCGEEVGSAPELPGDAELPLAPVVELAEGQAILPSRTFALADGSSVSFYLSDDGSVGVRGEGDAAATVLPEIVAETGDAPAELWWAVSPPGTPVPEALLALHDEQVASGERRPFDDVSIEVGQGWATALTTPRYAPCVNSTFSAAHCLPNAPYNHGGCNLDSDWDASWTTAAILRYHAAMCLDTGTVDDALTYSEYVGSSCTVFRIYSEIWGPLLGGSPYTANSYLYWIWVAPAGGNRRSWTHSAWNVGGSDNLDWAFMQIIPGTCL
ncbi:MAG: hypothetical protein ABMB14_16310 [Myxococcota bacterium]